MKGRRGCRNGDGIGWCQFPPDPLNRGGIDTGQPVARSGRQGQMGQPADQTGQAFGKPGQRGHRGG